MVKDLKGIWGMVSLDIYQIINYSSFSKKHIICLIFKRLGFFINIKVWFCEARFYLKNQTIWNINVSAQLAQKVGKYLSERICSRQVITKFFKFKTIWKAFLYSKFQKFSKYNAQMFEAQVYLFMYVRTKFFFKKYT